MMSLTFASRNLWRHRRRTLITALSVAFGVWLSVLFVGTRQSTYDRLVAAGTKAGYGHVMIARRGYLETPSAAIHFAFEDPLKNLAADSVTIRSAVPRIFSNAVVMTSGKNTGAALLGIDAAKETGDNNLFLQGLAIGKPWAAEDELGCLVGAAMAEHLKLELGGKIVYTTTDLNGQMVSHLAYVRGIFRTGSFEFDGHLVLLPLAALQKVVGFAPGEASLIAVYAAPGVATERLAVEIASKNHDPAIEARDWRESLPDLAQYIRIDEAIYRVLLVFIGVIIASGILNTMMLNVIERRREFGIMLAVGMTPYGLMFMVGWEAVLIGAIGLALGAASASPLYFYLSRVGIDMTWLMGEKLDAGGVAIDFVIGCRLSPADLGMIGAALLLMTLVSVAYPAAKAAWTAPVRTIRST